MTTALGSGAPLAQAQQRTEVVHHGLEHTGLDPALRLLVHGGPGREVVRHVAPLRAGLHHPARGVEHLAQWIRALRRILATQRQIGRDEGPFLVAHITRVAGAPPTLDHGMALQLKWHTPPPPHSPRQSA
jgi:hypothetical protein